MRKLTFGEAAPVYDSRLENVMFQAFDGRHLVRCVVGAKALQAHFGAQGRSQSQLIAAFQRGRSKIRLAALRKYAAMGQTVPELVLTACDFGADNALAASLARHLRLAPEEPGL